MKAQRTPLKKTSKWSYKIWLMNMLLICTYILIQTPSHLWLMSISQGAQAKPFNGAMMPIAFIPDWRKSDYIDQRANLDYSSVKQTDLIPLPRVENIKNDFNSNFTYLTMFRGKYMDEERQVGVGSHDGVDIRAPIGTPIFAIANGKVVKTRDEANNKYITIEHRDVKYGGKVGKFYSSYLHLSAVVVQPGEVVDKGTLIGRVGMTGMTTTPHLHIQVDNDEAPFYPYWPFDYSEANDAGLNMFDAVDAGLNQDLILKYSVDPLDFIKKATTIDGPSVAAERTEPVVPVTKTTPKPNPKLEISLPKPTVKENSITNTGGNFKDVSTNHVYFNSIAYLTQRGILKGYKDNTFGPDKTVTRAELLAILMKTMKIEQKGEIISGTFSDIPKDHWVNAYVSEAVKRSIISASSSRFYPERNISRAEFLAMLVGATNETLPVGVTKTWKDVKWSDWSYRYAVFAFQKNLIDNIGGDRFQPSAPLTRGQVAEALYRYLRATNKL